LLEPFLPNTCAKIRAALHVTTPWDGAGGVLLEPGKAIDKLPILFQKVDEEVIEAQRAKLAAGKPQEVQLEAAKDAIAFEQFSGLDIRVATILEAEAVPKTKKLLKLKVDTGIDQRTVVSGIAEHYAPQDIIGQQVSLLINLEPRKIRGVESQGMILMAEDAEGKLRFVAPTEAMGPGSTIR
jgi:methionyl-tRNA synthetase